MKNRIRRLRFDHDEMTQQELAAHVGVTRQTIIALESGRYNPSLILALRIAKTFEEPVENVFELEIPDDQADNTDL
ncbi:MAG: helix-turn-helix transcriptional regulator [Pirellulales bacterium]|nr:helix-turn-helix transcriptional regulator [Pirellulales bacterium]